MGQVSFSTEQIKAAMGGAIPEDAVRPPHPPRPGQAKSPAPQNVVALAKARLRDVKKDLRRMKALEKERDELERLIAAAERKPKPVVLRELKSTAG